MAIAWDKYWSRVNLGAEFSWKIPEKARKQLAEITNTPANLFDGTPTEVNLRLRQFIGPRLHDDEIKDRLCNWIIWSWGGIKRNNKENFARLIADFGDFSVPSVWKVAKKYDRERISSWSKLAAFAHPEVFAVYDAKTAAALNCIESLSGKKRYFIPGTQIGYVDQISDLLVRDREMPWLNYEDYLEELKAAAVHAKCSLLNVEETLFANSPGICKQWQKDTSKT